MIRKIGWAVLAFGWVTLVFLFTLWLTFPSDAVVQRLMYEANARSGGRRSVQIGSAAPYWFGLKLRDVRLFDQDPRNADAPPTLVAASDVVAASVNPFGLARGRPYVKGFLRLGESDVRFAAGILVDREKGKGWSLTDVWLSAPGASMGDLALLSPYPMTATGTVDLAADITGETGMRDASGTATITGASLVLSELGLEAFAAFGAPSEITIDDLAIELSVRDGRATIQKGTMTSSIGNVTLDGDIALKDDLSRSNFRVDAVIELADDFEKFGAMAGEAMWADGRLHYTCSGYMPPSCKPAREGRTSRTGARGGTAPVTPSDDALDEPAMPPTAADDPERARRREEVRERLRKRREEREAGRAAIPAGDEPVGAATDKAPADEEPFEDELPLEDEGAGAEDPFTEEE